MKKKDCIYIAINNILSMKKTSLKIIIGLITIVVILLSIGYYTILVNYSIRVVNDKSKNLAFNYYIGSNYINPNKLNNILENVDEVNGYRINAYVDLVSDVDYFNTLSSSMDNYYIEIDGVKHKGENDYSNRFKKEDVGYKDKSIFNVTFDVVGFVNANDVFLSKNEMLEFKKKHFDENFLKGELCKNPKEIIMSDYIIEKFGVNKNEQDSLIGKEITIGKVGNSLYKPYLEGYKLTGIFNADIVNMQSIADAHAYVTVSKNKSLNFYKYITMIFSDDFYDVEKANVILADYFDIKAVMSEEATLFSLLQKQQIILYFVLSIILGAISFAIFISILNIVSFYFNKKIRYLSLLKSIGMSNKNILNILLYELYILNIFSLIIGFLIYIILKITVLGDMFMLFDIIKQPFLFSFIFYIIIIIITFVLLYIIAFIKYKYIEKISIVDGLNND